MWSMPFFLILGSHSSVSIFGVDCTIFQNDVGHFDMDLTAKSQSLSETITLATLSL